MFAIVSDIHANLEAFSTVLSEIDRRGVQHIICLGDIIGYGPNPMECIDLVLSRCGFAEMQEFSDLAPEFGQIPIMLRAEIAIHIYIVSRYKCGPDEALRPSVLPGTSLIFRSLQSCRLNANL